MEIADPYISNQWVKCCEMSLVKCRDTEDWSNDAENAALRHRNKIHFNIHLKQKTIILNCNIANAILL